MSKSIIVTLKNGKINIEAQGYTGTSCEEATKFLENLGVVESTEQKPEYFDVVTATEVGYNGC